MNDRVLKVFFIVFSVLAAIVIFLKVDLARMGGPVMVPMIFASIFAFGIIFAKIKQLNRNSLSIEIFLKNIFEHIERQRIKEAIDICDQSQTSVARVLKAGIMKFDRSKDEIKEAMEDAYLYEVPLLEENLSILATIIQVVPLLGFLGTLTGAIEIFQVVQAKGASFVSVGSLDLASGIWEALVCSAAGLLIAIPLLVAYNYLAGRVKSLLDEIERGATDLAIFLVERRMSS